MTCKWRLGIVWLNHPSPVQVHLSRFTSENWVISRPMLNSSHCNIHCNHLTEIFAAVICILLFLIQHMFWGLGKHHIYETLILTSKSFFILSKARLQPQTSKPLEYSFRNFIIILHWKPSYNIRRTLERLQDISVQVQMTFSATMDSASRNECDVTEILTAKTNRTRRNANVSLPNFYAQVGSVFRQWGSAMARETAKMVRTKTTVVFNICKCLFT